MSLLPIIGVRNRIQNKFALNLDSLYRDNIWIDESETSIQMQSNYYVEANLNLDELNDTGFFTFFGKAASGSSSNELFGVWLTSNTLTFQYRRGNTITYTNFLDDFSGDIKIRIQYTGTLKQLFIDDIEILSVDNASVPTQTSTRRFLVGAMSGSAVDSYVVGRFFKGKIYDIDINGVKFSYNEGSGDKVYGNPDNENIEGNIYTINSMGVSYLNAFVWTRINQGSLVGNLFLMIGQSNMDGRGSVAAASPQYLGIIPNSKIWVNGSWEDLEAGVNGGSTGQFGLIFSMAYELQNLDPSTTNYFVFVAQGGTGFADNDWNQGDPLYNQAVNDLNTAGLTGNFDKKAICWQQGEADSKTIPDSGNYESAEGNMIDNIKLETGFANFISGKLPNITATGYDYYSAVNTAKDNNLISGKSTDTINTSDLSLQGDGLHFPTASYETLGVRYFNIVKDL